MLAVLAIAYYLTTVPEIMNMEIVSLKMKAHIIDLLAIKVGTETHCKKKPNECAKTRQGTETRPLTSQRSCS